MYAPRLAEENMAQRGLNRRATQVKASARIRNKAAAGLCPPRWKKDLLPPPHFSKMSQLSFDGYQPKNFGDTYNGWLRSHRRSKNL